MDRKGMWKQSLTVANGVFKQERLCSRVIMGYLLGIAVLAYWMSNFFRYVHFTREPINILETFIVIEQHSLSILFLVLGWILVMADAPFIKQNTFLTLHRCSRRSWNAGMLLYIILQAFLYTITLAAVSVVASCLNGFISNIWSNPVYMLSKDYGNDLGVIYNITFHWIEMMINMTVPHAFMVTILYLFAYLAFMGVLLYICNLLLKGIWGTIIVLGIHLIGYLFMQDGLIEKSLLAHAIPGYFIDNSNRYLISPCIFLVFIVCLSLLSFFLIKKVDFRESEEAEG